MDEISQRRPLFGENIGWDLDQWTSSDDRVRGGNSKSSLDPSPTGVAFHGHLDIDTLGGAGFASQRTLGDDRHWDLSPLDGIEVSIDPSQSDHNVYTLILKDHILPPNPDNGREQSTVSWEFDFSTSNCHGTNRLGSASTTASIFMPWQHFKPTYRGKPCDDTKGLDLRGIKRISIMIRSFFGSQQGDFRLHLVSITAFCSPNATELSTPFTHPQDKPALPATNDATMGSRDSRDGFATWFVSTWNWLCGNLYGRR
ncbi:CIA30-domain-containing protein [Exophiala viscosa]|uniref:CIA30-domain-containing protein n=1 Tax=Exophiala viscosa TaxID=2486360 RepID=A0AAN6E4X7_9EURO|nr:CIA30-domain-containing protein [Exophiala viscosa]